MIFYEYNEKICEKTFEVYHQCNIRSFPIDCKSVLEHYGFKIIAYSSLKEQNSRLYELSYTYSSDAFTCGNIMAYNDKKPMRRIRFSLMHEFGHYILEHEKETPEIEKEADSFASNFLAPRILIHKLGYRNADQIHDVFGLSYAASNCALTSYRNWYRNICLVTRTPLSTEINLENYFYSIAESQFLYKNN